jgi:hypothetical protein
MEKAGVDGGNADDDVPSSLGGVSEEIQYADDASFNKDEEDYPFALERTLIPLSAAILRNAPLSVFRAIVERRPESVHEEHVGIHPFRDAVKEGLPVAKVKFLYDSWPDAIRRELMEGPPLHAISAKTPVETVEFLLDEYPEALLR